jgi:hypothetical protein
MQCHLRAVRYGEELSVTSRALKEITVTARTREECLQGFDATALTLVETSRPEAFEQSTINLSSTTQEI